MAIIKSSTPLGPPVGEPVTSAMTMSLGLPWELKSVLCKEKIIESHSAELQCGRTIFKLAGCVYGNKSAIQEPAVWLLDWEDWGGDDIESGVD